MGSGTGEMRPTDSLGLHDLVGSGTAVLSSDLAEEKGCSFLIAVTKILDGDDLLGAAYGGGRIYSANVRGFRPSAQEGHARVTHFTPRCTRRQRSWYSAGFLPFLPLKPPTHGVYCAHSGWVFLFQLLISGETITDTPRVSSISVILKRKMRY